ncbi:hypothetical protein [Streptomyces kanamyceticus]|uniref:Uncharacterized protein n=1 Tax=Streptomyces kanamyceticus TaxID=1967 RepID=A0A5J6GAR3_STRKN|nr:hypothetical protein [Streptomyces kanamyceticus]QEU90998.1 hypothetical protein CP970_08980 [Streptomyces kanamyceticus]
MTAAKKQQTKAGSAKASAELRLMKEAKIRDLIGDAAGDRLEASGVLYRDGVFLVVCDNLPFFIRISGELSPKAPENGALGTNRPAKATSKKASPKTKESPKAKGQKGKESKGKESKEDATAQAEGYEDLAYDPSGERHFTLSEAVPVKPKGFRARVQEYDARLRPRGTAVLDFALSDANKGLEGLEWVERGGTGYLLGLCEGNRCTGGKEGRKPGGGRIQVFRRGTGRWDRTDTIRLPASLPFEDYSSVSVRDGRIAVLSQASSALWVGRLSPKKWQVDEGTVYSLPTDDKGRAVYGTAEGVSWISRDHVVVVSDRAKKGQENDHYRAKDQSIHVFLIPSGG